VLEHGNSDDGVKAFGRERQIVSITYDVGVAPNDDVGIDNLYTLMAFKHATITGANNQNSLRISPITQQGDKAGPSSAIACIVICQARQALVDHT
jgi:hypothetical protein